VFSPGAGALELEPGLVKVGPQRDGHAGHLETGRVGGFTRIGVRRNPAAIWGHQCGSVRG